MIHLRPIIYELKILTKERETVRFGDVINYAQEDVITQIEDQLNASGAARIIVLKARQIGISTAIEACIFALSIIFRDFQSLIISHEASSAEHILGMTKRYWTTYVFKDYHNEKYNGRKQLSWSDLESNIEVATAKNVTGGRSKTLHALHASEVAFWEHPDELVTGLRQAIPTQGITLIVYESTADGVGNFFHVNWVGASNNETEFTPLFYPWFNHPEYQAQYLPSDQQARYALLGQLSQEEKVLRGMGISDSRLLWRRYAIVNLCSGSVDTFHVEYPTTPNEAFLSTGHNVFPLLKLQDHYVYMKPDVGILERGPGDKVIFKRHPDGWLKVYRYPSPDLSWGIYQIGADPTHTTAGDKACAQVFSRRTLEQCAVIGTHTDAVELGRMCCLLGDWYNEATVAPEKEGGGGATIGYMLGQNYSRVWESQRIEKTPGMVVKDTYGWGTNSSTKPIAIAYLTNLIHQPLQQIGNQTYGFLLHDKETFEEMRDYISDGKGGYCNGDGSLFDDTVMATAICMATHFIDGPIGPYERSAREAVTLAASSLVAQGGAVGTIDVVRHEAPPDPTGLNRREEYDDAPPFWDDWDGVSQQ